MIQENKQLLLKDLCARLPYGVKVCIKLPNHQKHIFEEQVGELKELTSYGGYLVNSKGIDYRSFNLDIKPYLHQLSSMTEEEREKFNISGGVMSYNPQNDTWAISAFTPEAYDWLNANHFDYRGLIPKCLAIEVNKENNPYKEINL